MVLLTVKLVDTDKVSVPLLTTNAGLEAKETDTAPEAVFKFPLMVQVADALFERIWPRLNV